MKKIRNFITDYIKANSNFYYVIIVRCYNINLKNIMLFKIGAVLFK